MRRRSLIFAMTGACGTSGGIAAANVNVLRALSDLSEKTGLGLRVLSLNEEGTDRPEFLPRHVDFTGFRGRKYRFVASLLGAAAGRPLFLFDHVTLAAPLLPIVLLGWAETVIFAHGSEAGRRLKRTSRWSFRRAALCLTNSAFTLKKMREFIPRFNGEACLLGLSPEFALDTGERLSQAERIELTAADGRAYALGRRYLLLVARMHSGEREKGHDALLQVMPALLERHPDVQVVFAGPGDDRERLRSLAESMGVGAAVFLPGFLRKGELQRLYRHCYAFVMPSRQEGFGLVYLEAMNYAKSCVGCFEQGTEDVVVHGETGILVKDPYDADELLTAVCRLLEDPELNRRMGLNGHRRLHSVFTAQHYQARIKERIAKLL